MPLGSTRVCMTTSPAPLAAQTSATPRSRRPDTSLTSDAPAAIAASATSGLYVSIETTAPSSPVSRTISGTTRSISVAAVTAGR